MALTEDQRAMLQLLLQSGQSYEDIGSLLGSDVDEVRQRARAAFTEMGGRDPDGEVSLTDYLLGQADPIGRADAARHLQSDPEANALATKLAAQLRLIAPGADLPDIPLPREKRGGSPTKPAAAAAGSTASAPPAEKAPRFGPGSLGGDSRGGTSGSALSGSQKRLIGALGAGAVVVLIVVLLVTGVFGGGDDNKSSDTSSASSGDTTSSDSQNAANTTPSQGNNVVGAVLKPVGDADPDALGTAAFGRVKKTPVLQVVVKGLTPTAKGENYSVWLYRSDRAAFRLSGVRVGKEGGIAAQLPVPQQVLRFISDGTFNKIDISLTKDAELKAEAKRDQKLKKLTLRHLGESVMQGPITGPGVTTGATGSGPTGTTGPTGPTSP